MAQSSAATGSDELIGQSAMGMVYRVTNIGLDRTYALKVLAPELAEDEQFRKRSQREMQIAASLERAKLCPRRTAG